MRKPVTRLWIQMWKTCATFACGIGENTKANPGFNVWTVIIGYVESAIKAVLTIYISVIAVIPMLELSLAVILVLFVMTMLFILFYLTC